MTAASAWTTGVRAGLRGRGAPQQIHAAVNEELAWVRNILDRDDQVRPADIDKFLCLPAPTGQDVLGGMIFLPAVMLCRARTATGRAAPTRRGGACQLLKASRRAGSAAHI